MAAGCDGGIHRLFALSRAAQQWMTNCVIKADK
jgi:hypothetical protein